MNLLFTNVGRRTYLLEYALELRDEYDLSIFVCDTSERTAGFWVSECIKKFITPRVGDDELEYVETLLQKCIDNEIDVIIPLMDYELAVLSRARERFKQLGIQVVVSSVHTIENCLDKRRNYSFCQSHGLETPKTWFTWPAKDVCFPVILKKVQGSGSVDQHIVHSKPELEILYNDGYLIQEYIEGTEYGMDIFNDLEGRFLHAACRRKLLMRAGETDKAISYESDSLLAIAKRISKAFQHVGNMDADVLVDSKGTHYCIDFNPRFGGGYPLTHMMGYNYLKWIIDLVQGKQITVADYPQRHEKKYVMVKGISTYCFEENK